MGRPPLTWEVFEVQAAGGCSVPQGHHHSLAWSHTPPPTCYGRQQKSVTFKDKRGPPRPVLTD